LRLLRRIRETADNELPKNAMPFAANKLAILYVQPSNNGTEVVEISVNAEGEFTRLWPEGFFAERARELY
jgi:predicted ATPase